MNLALKKRHPSSSSAMSSHAKYFAKHIKLLNIKTPFHSEIFIVFGDNIGLINY